MKYRMMSLGLVWLAAVQMASGITASISMTQGENQPGKTFAVSSNIVFLFQSNCSALSNVNWLWLPSGDTATGISTKKAFSQESSAITDQTAMATAANQATNISATSYFTIVKVDRLEGLDPADSTWAMLPYEPPLLLGYTVSNAAVTGDFRAVSKPTDAGTNNVWPLEKPVWGGAASGVGDEKKVLFTEGGVFAVSVECGNSVSGQVAIRRVEIYSPSGDPATPAEADAENEVVFELPFPGPLVSCRAYPTANPELLRWTMDPIESQAIWQPALSNNPNLGVDQYAEAFFTNLPAHNAAFGPKNITLTMEGAPYPDVQPVEVFFRPLETTHPPTSNAWQQGPNWFYYWQDAGVGVNKTNLSYDSNMRTDWGGSTEKPMRIRRILQPGTPIGSKIGPSAYDHNYTLGPRTTGTVARAGIDSFHIVTVHEFKHVTDFQAGWGYLDTDNDRIADYLEDVDGNGYDAGDPSDLDDINTHGGEIGVNRDRIKNDAEWFAYTEELNHFAEIGAYDSKDWSRDWQGVDGRNWDHP